MKKVIDAKKFKHILEEITDNFVDENKVARKKDRCDLCVVGIHTRGVFLGKRIAGLLKKKHRLDCPVGSLDITLYRDDVGEIGNQPLVKETHIPFGVEGKTILLVDDVLFTGRTIRAAMDALLELGRPRLIRLAVVVDRAGRELPIQADYCGLQMTASAHEDVQLKIKEVDRVDGVWLARR